MEGTNNNHSKKANNLAKQPTNKEILVLFDYSEIQKPRYGIVDKNH